LNKCVFNGNIYFIVKGVKDESSKTSSTPTSNDWKILY